MAFGIIGYSLRDWYTERTLYSDGQNISTLGQACELNNSHWRVCSHYAVLTARLGNLERARQITDEIFRVNSNFFPALKTRARIEWIARNKRDYCKYSTRYNNLFFKNSSMRDSIETHCSNPSQLTR